ncbi:hypothetical protein LOD99_1845 [Oopsacas minuta]|uniref:DUF659 domain-containing protein n=1 Tax=Oopsacas minuta TaxID=111878 RepID=A0AAV7K529_9METZ|nr:hypothetical protein LOD99_1845 [Oopsacas minuta]
MKQHHTECKAAINLISDVSNQTNTPVHDIVNLEKRERAISLIRMDPPAKRQKSVVSRMKNFVMPTSETEKAAIDRQNCTASNNNALSGYQVPSRFKISNNLLSDLQVSIQSYCKEKLAYHTVTIMSDAWSNIHNEPIDCASVPTPDDGESDFT